MKAETTKLLAQLKAADLKGDVPSVSEQTAQFLYDLILKHGSKTGLEIGTAHAYSTIYLASALAQNNGHLTTIEHSPPSFNQAKINLYRAKAEANVTQHLGRAQSVIPTLNQTFDFIFIDGIKKSTLEFFELAAPQLNKGGIIVIDDVIKFKNKMQTFYDYLDSQNLWTFTVYKLDADDGIMVITRA